MMMIDGIIQNIWKKKKKTNHKATRFNKLRAESFDDWNLSIAQRSVMKDHNVCHDSY